MVPIDQFVNEVEEGVVYNHVDFTRRFKIDLNKGDGVRLWQEYAPALAARRGLYICQLTKQSLGPVEISR